MTPSSSSASRGSVEDLFAEFDKHCNTISDKPVPKVRETRKKQASSGGCNVPDANRFAEYIAKYALAVLQIRVSENKRGTGCLIGGNLLITNHHVIGSRNEASKAEVRCWAVVESNSNAGNIAWKTLKFNHLGYFFTCENKITEKGVQRADEKHLDFTIVELENGDIIKSCG